MRCDYLIDGPEQAERSLILAHGAGAPMDSPFMDFFAQTLGRQGFRVIRFEFPYMQARRLGEGKKPPNRLPILEERWLQALQDQGHGHFWIGGKSMGGRIASLIADRSGARGLICLGYPFHPPGKPEKLRTAHLENLKTPALIVQGERDPFGTREEVPHFPLSPATRTCWIPDGDHSFKPRKKSGHSEQGNWIMAAASMCRFMEATTPT